MNPLVGTLAHEGGFVEATQNELEFSGIGVYIADGINPGDIGLVIETIVHNNGVFINFQPPICYGSEFGGQTKKRDKIVQGELGCCSPLSYRSLIPAVGCLVVL